MYMSLGISSFWVSGPVSSWGSLNLNLSLNECSGTPQKKPPRQTMSWPPAHMFLPFEKCCPPQDLLSLQYVEKTGVGLMASPRLGAGEENQQRFSPSSSRRSLISL